jgi:SAM-dependent methyltransferase
MSDWTKQLFNRVYVQTEGLALSATLTRREVNVAVDTLELQASDTILDLACGHGRHSIELTRQGFGKVTGLDFNAAAIDQARADAIGTSAKFLHGDMLALTYNQEFDVVLSFFNSVFYWDDQTHLQIFQGIHNALKPNGRLLLDSYNPFFSVHHKLLEKHRIFGKMLAVRKQLGAWRVWLSHQIRNPGKPRVWHETKTQFDPATGLVRGVKHMHAGTTHESQPLEIRLYTYTEVKWLLEQAGFVVEKVVSNDGGVFKDISPRFLVVARKNKPLQG